MVRSAAAVLFFAVLALTASTLLWLRASSVVDEAGMQEGELTLAAFERTHPAEQEIDIPTKYAGRLDLIDPRLALPTWHKHPRDEAARVTQCSTSAPALAFAFTDPALAKAHEQACRSAASSDMDADVDAPPFMHPSGKSYALLGLARRSSSSAVETKLSIRKHVRSFHVLELASLDPSALDPSDRALATLSFRSWEALTRGDAIVLTPTSLVIAEHGPLGLAKLRFHARSEWDAFAQRESIALTFAARSRLSSDKSTSTVLVSTRCARPASPDLCWTRLSPAQTHRKLFFASTIGSATIVALASIALGIAWARERRRAHRDRIHVLRTLTHELRTPATSLRLDIEPLRAAYDDLPTSCQEPLLRISDGIERLHRVLHRSARYMALFETSSSGAGADRTAEHQIVKLRDVPSVREMLEELIDEWPEGVTLASKSEDGPMRTDPEWLAVAVRNLVENAGRHGTPPIVVTWSLEHSHLVLRVTDHGQTPHFSLRRSVSPWERDAKSEGLGLGLAIVDRVADLLHGRLTHEATPTVFQLRLPSNITPSSTTASRTESSL